MASKTIIGLDLGGTKTAVARYDAETWAIQAKEKISTRAKEGFQTVFEDALALIDKHRAADTVAVGIGVPGLLRQPEGFLLNTPNIPGGRDIPLKKLLEERL